MENIILEKNLAEMGYFQAELIKIRLGREELGRKQSSAKNVECPIKKINPLSFR